MRILFLCHRIPYPPDKGEKIRAFHELRGIAQHNEVDLFTLADRQTDLEHKTALARYCHDVKISPIVPALAQLRSLPNLFSQKPLTVAYFYSAEFRREIRRALLRRSYDRIFVYCSAMAQYVEGVDHIPTLIDMVDLDSDKWMQYAAVKPFPFSTVYKREWRYLRAYERKLCETFPSILVTTEREAQLARQISRWAPVHVIPNGVDSEYFSPSAVAAKSPIPHIVFTGDMSYFPNEQATTFFAVKVLPLIQKQIRDARFLIVGRNPTRNVRRLQKQPGVEVTGFVPDVRPYLAMAHVSIAPFSIATGIQNKILEAMVSGLPVVATLRAIQGLSSSVAEIVETGETAKEFADKVTRFLSNPQLAHRIGIEGRARVMTQYSWRRSTDTLLALLARTSGANRPNTETLAAHF